MTSPSRPPAADTDPDDTGLGDTAPEDTGLEDTGLDAPDRAEPRRITRSSLAVLAALGAIVLLVIGATAGVALFSGGAGSADQNIPTAGSVDAGFAQDMIVHHGQGVLMAHIAELDSSDPEIQQIAYDIEYTQTAQIGQMQGWLALWGVPEVSDAPHMAWMTVGGHNHTGGSDDPLATTGLMPGMATDAEMAKLQSLRGKDSDIYFLQLMIRHHEGGAAMMAYAEDHAGNAVVRNFAKQMLIAQNGEIGVMTGMLTARGAQPLPFTAPELTGSTSSPSATG